MTPMSRLIPTDSIFVLDVLSRRCEEGCMSALPIEVVQGPERAAALLDPVRLRILEGLAEPDSAAGVARRLGLPRQRVNYHLHELEKHELVRFVEERRKGNCVERIVRATA